MSTGARTWGAGAEPADPSTVLSATQDKIAEQDDRLERIARSGEVQRNIATDMNHELKYQNRLLDDIDGHVDSTGMKIRQGTVQARRVEEKAKQKGLLGTVFVLFLIIIVIFILMFYF